ncbi:hypothetical protein [Kitasatospora sp. NPDC127116]|uniref:hypothetical protein n=1 Tax=Kitasatospora sp. NPDC127116 TaxID=3345367 RepID=UPI003626BC49
MTSAYQQQLAQQLRSAEDELGQLRRRVAELTGQRDTAQAAASERAVIPEHARDLLEPWGGHGDAWPDIAPAIEVLIAERLKYGNGYTQEHTRAEAAEARIAAVRALADVLETEEAYGGYADANSEAARRIRDTLDAPRPTGTPCRRPATSTT